MASALIGEAFPTANRTGSFTLIKNDKQDTGSRDQDAQARLQQHHGAPGSSLFDAVPFTPSQGACGGGVSAMTSTAMFSPFSSFQRPGGVDTALGLVASDGSSGSDVSIAGLSTSPMGASVAASSYSPFMGAPWGNSLGLNSASDTAGPTPLELPNSPMSPGIVFNPTPTGGAPSSPRALFQQAHHGSASFTGLSGGLRTPSGSLVPPAFSGTTSTAAAAAAAADAVAAQAALNSGLPQFYFNAAAAAVAGNGGTSPLQAALNQTLINQHTASLAAQQQQQHQQQHQQQLLQASLSAALANHAAAAAANPFLHNYPANLLTALEPVRSAGGSLSLDGGLQQQASVTALLQQQQQQQQLAAVMAAQQQHVAAASQLRRNMSTPAGVAAQLGLGGAAAHAQLGLGAGALAAGGAGLPLSAQMGRLHVTHSADLSHLDAAALLGGGPGGLGGRPKFSKARKNSEPKIGPDGQPRLNARQRRTLRRAKERALKGLLEVSQALLQKAEVQVTVPNISHLTALEELAAVEAEKEAASANGGEPGDGAACLSPCGSSGGRASGSGGGGRAGGAGGAGQARGVSRSQQLAAAAAAVEESVCEIARAAVAAVSAQANGRDTSSAAAAAQAAAAQAASAAASAGAVLPPGFVMPEAEEGGSDELQPCNSDLVEGLAPHSAPTSPVGSNITVGNPGSGRSSSSSSSSMPGSARCSSSSTGSVASSYGGAGAAAAGGGAAAAKPPLCQPPRPASTIAVSGPGCSPLCSPLPSPTPSCGAAAAGGGGTPLPPAAPGKAAPAGASQLEGIDIAGLIGQLSLKKDEGMVDDKLIRDLQIIQSLIGALKSPAAPGGGSLDGSGGSGSMMMMVPGGPSASSSPVPSGRHMRAAGLATSRSLPKQRCNSPGVMAGGALHML